MYKYKAKMCRWSTKGNAEQVGHLIIEAESGDAAKALALGYANEHELMVSNVWLLPDGRILEVVIDGC